MAVSSEREVMHHCLHLFVHTKRSVSRANAIYAQYIAYRVDGMNVQDIKMHGLAVQEMIL